MKPPKEEAKELVLQFYEVVKNKYPSTNGMPLSKQCAIIAVDKILKVAFYATEEIYNHYLQVKKEIENYE